MKSEVKWMQLEKYLPFLGYPDQEKQKLFVLTCKWLLAYHILKLIGISSTFYKL